MPPEQHLKIGDYVRLVMTDDPSQIAGFEKKLRITQVQAVDHLIETTLFGKDDLPHLVGNKGTPAERIAALWNAIIEFGVMGPDKPKSPGNAKAPPRSRVELGAAAGRERPVAKPLNLHSFLHTFTFQIYNISCFS